MNAQEADGRGFSGLPEMSKSEEASEDVKTRGRRGWGSVAHEGGPGTWNLLLDHWPLCWAALADSLHFSGPLAPCISPDSPPGVAGRNIYQKQA